MPKARDRTGELEIVLWEEEGMKLEEIRKSLIARRLQEGLSLRALSEIVGVSFAGLGRVERGAGSPTRDTLQRVQKWIEAGEASSKRCRGTSWMSTVEQRLARIEKELGIED